MQDRSRQLGKIHLQRTAGPYIGSNPEVPARNREVRFALRNGHGQPGPSGPVRAIRGLMQCNKWKPLDGCKRVDSRL